MAEMISDITQSIDSNAIAIECQSLVQSLVQFYQLVKEISLII